jgi:SAM-dependent methyltransferase
MEALEPGWNVLQDVVRFGVTPHQYNEKMHQLYRDGDGFIFETLVFWSKPWRYRWTQQALERLQLYATKSGKRANDLRILILGDGTGSDSLYLARSGFSVNYYDVPGSKTFDFAMQRFAYHRTLDNHIMPISDYSVCMNSQYDAVISFEVLEHIVQPLQTIKDIASMLKPGGIALITEDFGNISNRFPTHLEVSSKFKGKTPFLFLKYFMLLSWYSKDVLFKPVEFVKLNVVSNRDLLSLLKDHNVRTMYLAQSPNILLRFIGRLPYIYRHSK